MEFGVDKFATAVFKCQKLTKVENLVLQNNIEIKNLEDGESYEYLGFHEGDGIQNKIVKGRIRKEYYSRIRKINNTKLNTKNKITASNSGGDEK